MAKVTYSFGLDGSDRTIRLVQRIAALERALVDGLEPEAAAAELHAALDEWGYHGCGDGQAVLGLIRENEQLRGLLYAHGIPHRRE